MNPADMPAHIATDVDPGVVTSLADAPGALRLRDLAFAALGALLVHTPTEPDAAPSPEERFLHDAHAAAGYDDWPAHVVDALAHPAPVDALLSRAHEHFGLTAVETLTLALTAAVEDDPVACRVLVWLQAPHTAPRPTLALLARALVPLDAADTGAVAADCVAATLGVMTEPQQAEARVLHTLAYGAATRHGLLKLDSETRDARPLCETTLRMPAPIAAALAGQGADWPGTQTPPLWPVPEPLSTLAPELDVAIAEWARDLAAMPRSGLVIRSAADHEARGIAAAIVRRLGARPAWFGAELPADHAACGESWLVLTGRIPVFDIAGAPGDVVSLPALLSYAGPALVVTGLDGGVRRNGPMADWRVPLPDAATRAALWADALDPTPAAMANPCNDLVSLAARRYRAGYAQITDHAQLARMLAAGRASPASLQRAATMTPAGRALDALAQALTEAVPDDALVANAALRADLARVVQRCEQREQLHAGLGASARTRACDGVRALFTGGSGTGKSLAAQWVAYQLGLPIYRVDLAAMLSKWIGETEKNLAELLARAEHADAVLLFDEADTLFGKRTEITTANDRFANAQTNYLLQRIETHSGVVFLTSNSRARFDPAFARRLDFIIDFAAPDADARRRLWQAHLGDASDCSPADLNRLAALGDCAGGHVRNAVLAAAAQARARGARIAYADIADGLRGEYRKLGRTPPGEL